MNKIINYIRTSVGLQSIIIWLIIFLVLLIQPLWTNVRLSITIASTAFIGIVITYYLNQLILIPKILMRRHKVVYILFSIIMISLMAFICAKMEFFAINFFNVTPTHEIRFGFSVSRFFTFFILTYAISSIIFFSKKTTEDAKLKDKLLNEKKMLEVRVLKSQINSHFLFNALNNIYSMIYFKDEYTSGYVLKLAQMMRYVMEDCETELTSLSKEIEYIRNFIDFQKLRFESDKDISFTCNVNENMNISVPPMVFQPLVENCFKHTPLDVDKNSYIHITLEIKEKQIRFVSENSQPLLKQKPNVKENGIGIENVKRRLFLYYGDNFKLDTFAGADCFKVELSINL